MRIDDPFKGPAGAAPKPAADAVDKIHGENAAVGKASKAKPAADAVAVSDAAKALAANSSGPVDEAKVARLRAAIADRTFTVDAGAIAKKLLGDEG